MLSVLIRIDAAGETPLLVEDSETLCPGPGVRWRFVSEVEDREQGRAVVERLKQRRCPSCGGTARTWIAESNGRAIGIGTGSGLGAPGWIAITPRLELHSTVCGVIVYQYP